MQFVIFEIKKFKFGAYTHGYIACLFIWFYIDKIIARNLDIFRGFVLTEILVGILHLVRREAR